MVLTSRVMRRAMARIGMCSCRGGCSSGCSSGVNIVGSLLVAAVGQLDDMRHEPSLAGLEHALFGVGEPGELELRELFERLLGLEEASLELARGGAEWGDRGLARSRRGGARIAQQRLAGRGVRRRPP